MDWKRNAREGAPLPRLVLLALFFLAGVFFGQVSARQVSPETGRELAEYLQVYLSLEEELSPRAALSALVLYFRYPLLAVRLAFAAAGVVLLPFVTAAFGFFLSFSVCCFTAAFGEGGVLLALSVFGLRCAVTLPCYFLLAGAAWQTSAALAGAAAGRRSGPVYGRDWWTRAAVCAGVLLAGLCADLYTSAALLQMALERILTLT